MHLRIRLLIFFRRQWRAVPPRPLLCADNSWFSACRMRLHMYHPRLFQWRCLSCFPLHRTRALSAVRFFPAKTSTTKTALKNRLSSYVRLGGRANILRLPIHLSTIWRSFCILPHNRTFHAKDYFGRRCFSPFCSLFRFFKGIIT